MMEKVRFNYIKVISIILLFLMIFSVLEIFVNTSNADSNRYSYNGYNLDTGKYPGYREKIEAIKAAHPNWDVVIMETDLDWNQVILAESSFTASNTPYSLIQGKSGAWICSACGSRTFDTGSWYHASESAIRYYMDPRNWMDPYSPAILQFLKIGRVDTSDDAIYNAIQGTFLTQDGLGWENARAINNASKNNNANPFYVIARIIQEQGVSGGSTYKMLGSDGQYYYNIFNIGASGNGKEQVVANALSTAMSKGWNTLEGSIAGGIQILFSDYIDQKQDTIYLNKFDVETYRDLYHQYMQNIEAPKSEASLMYSKISNSGLLNQPLTLVIPVFYNMPSSPCPSPDTMGENRPKNIRVKAGHTQINVRESRSKSSRIVTTIQDSSVIVLSVERYGDGWHKIVLVDGTVGYIYFDTNYFEEIDDITNCWESVVLTGTDVNLRSGPGTSHSIITTLTYGQQMTRIDKGRYYANGKSWDRVSLADGRQGFVSSEYLQIAVDAGNVFTIRADGGLNLRRQPAGEAIRIIPDGTRVTRTEIGTSEIDGHYWDKITTPDGAVGYVAREYLRDSSGNVPNGKVETPPQVPEVDPTSQIKTKKDDENKIIYSEPNVNENTLKNDYGTDITILKPDGSSIENGIVGTGYKVKINEIEYTVIKLGDLNSDGAINSGDTYLIKRIILEYVSADARELKLSADVNGDGEINAGDSYLLKREVLELSDIVLY